MQILVCEHCKTQFVPLRTNYKKPKKFCSQKCASIHSRTKQPHPCAVCNTLTKNPKYCSRSCSATMTGTTTPKRKKQPKSCPTCNTIFYVYSKKYCSDKCNPKRLNMTEEEKYKYRRARQNESWARYMSRRKYQTPADADIKAIQEFYINCPKGHEVDHIIPISKGGLHSISNLQYLTITENRKKSNKIL